jgi:putrescine aminotransferase
MLNFAKCVTNGVVPMGGVVCREHVHDAIMSVPTPAHVIEFSHGYTYSGHPVAAAVANANLEILERERIVERVRTEIAPYWAARWRELADHPLVGEARTLGLFGALELVPRKPSRAFFPERGSVGTRCRDLSVKNGLVMRAVWDTMIAAPPLVITPAEIDELVSKAVQTLDQLHQALRRDGLV